MGFGCTNVLAGLFAFITWLELRAIGNSEYLIFSKASGLVATTWTTFFNKIEVNEWAYGIFAIDIVFTISILYYTGQETCCRGRHSHSKRKLSWLCGMSTIMILCLFLVLYYYNINVLEHESLSKVVMDAFFVYVSALGLLAVIGSCFLCDYFCPEDEDDSGGGREKNENKAPPGSLDASLARMVEHVENHPLQKTYTLYSYGQRGEGSPFQVQMGWP